MSKVAIEGNASGTGTFTIASPNSNTNRTLTLPDSTGTVVVSGTTPSLNGITFPATQVASAGANTLDDYEEGTWTPDYFGGTTRGTTTYNLRSGNYIKIGRQVTVTGYMNIASATGTGDGQIDGLPFASTGSNLAYIATPFVSNINWGGGSYLSLYFFATDTKIDVQYLSDDGAATANPISDEGGVIAFTMTYQA
jgi:hypothetical protein